MTRKRVLVVEDEGIVARDIQRCLNSLGLDASRWVTMGEDAVNEVNDDPPDLVLMDIRLKGEMDGVQAAEEITASHDLPIVYLTAHADAATLERATETVPFGYVLKPFQERELQVAVEIALYKHAAEKELRDREQWLSTTLQSIADAVVATDSTGSVSLVNPEAERLSGWKPDAARGQRVEMVLDIVDETGGSPIAELVSRALTGGRGVQLDDGLVLRSRSGASIPVGGSVAPIRGGGSEAIGAVVVLRDLTGEHEAAQRVSDLLDRLRMSNGELAAEKGFLATLFESLPSPVLVVDAKGDVRIVNAALRPGRMDAADGRRTLPPGELVRCLRALRKTGCCGTMESCASCHLRSALDEALGGETVTRRRTELVINDDGKPRPVVMLVSVAPLDYDGERMAIVILEDVTELEGLRRLVKGADSFAGIVGSDPKMLAVYEAIREVASLPTPVLITGESGTGKELVARAIHSESESSNGSFIAVNCAALPEGLLESELFGHVRGSFTGATRDKKGRFELADGGTIFLDEIGELAPAIQVKLLRVLQEQAFQRVGDERTLKVNVRVISATNKDLRQEIAAGRFREDLFYRLCVVPIHLPPLRDRITDIPLLTQHALKRAATLAGREVPPLASETIDALTAHHWPGNVRELQNALEFALIKSHGEPILPSHLPPTVTGRIAQVWVAEARRSAAGQPSGDPLPRTRAGQHRRSGLTASKVEEALRVVDGNKAQAARDLGVGRATLYRFLDELEAAQGS